MTVKLLEEVNVDQTPFADTSADANFVEFRGKSTPMNSTGSQPSAEQKGGDEQLDPVDYIRWALDRFFRQYPEEKTDDPFSSKRLLTTTVGDVLENFSNNNSDTVEGVLSSFGEDLESLRNMALASFLKLLPL